MLKCHWPCVCIATTDDPHWPPTRERHAGDRPKERSRRHVLLRVVTSAPNVNCQLGKMLSVTSITVRENRATVTGGVRNSVPVGEEPRGECSRQRLRVVRAECTAARTTMPCVRPTGQLAQLSAVGENTRPPSLPQLVHYFLHPLYDLVAY